MASAIVYDNVAEGAAVVPGALFAGCKFWVAQRVFSRTSYLAKIEANGGQIVKLEKLADYLIADHVLKGCAPGTISYEFIDKSIAKGAILDPDDFPAGPRVGTARDAGSIARPAKGTRAAYTSDEDCQLYKWVRDAQARGIAVSGNELYKELEKKNPRHTWQSWRDRYLKKLQFMPPSAFSIPVNAPPSPPSDQSSRAAEVPVVRRTGLVKNKDRARAEGDVSIHKEQYMAKDHVVEPPAVRRTGLVKNKNRTPAEPGRMTPPTNPSHPPSPPAKVAYNVAQLAATFSTEDWEELYAFVEHIDSFTHDALSYETSWTNWAEDRDNQTPEQWRQYYERVVRPQWLSDPPSKRARIRRKVEERHRDDESSPPKIQSWSQTEGRDIDQQEEVGGGQEATGKQKPLDEASASNFQPSDSKLESEATAQQETPQYIRNGYESALKRIRGDTDAASGSANATRPTKIRRKTNMSPSPEGSAADQVNSTGEQPLEASSVAETLEARVEQPQRQTPPRVSQIIDLGDESESDASEDNEEELTPLPRDEDESAEDAEDLESLASEHAFYIPLPRPPVSYTDEDDEEDEGDTEGLESEIAEMAYEQHAPRPLPPIPPTDDEEDRDASDIESLTSSTDQTFFAPLPRPPQIPEASDDEDSLPSNSPTPRAARFGAFNTQAILSPSQPTHLISRLPRPLSSSPPHHPDSEASTTHSLQEFSSYLQAAPSPTPQSPVHTTIPRPASPTPSTSSSTSSHASTSSLSSSAIDPDPPLSGPEMPTFFSAQNAAGYTDAHISAALKRTRFRPRLAAVVLECWRRGEPLPNRRGVWALVEDEQVEEGDGVSLALLARKHTLDGWGGVTERMRFLEAWGSR